MIIAGEVRSLRDLNTLPSALCVVYFGDPRYIGGQFVAMEAARGDVRPAREVS
jgi:hypothetical protein